MLKNTLQNPTLSINKVGDDFLKEDDLEGLGFTKRMMIGTGYTSISSMCDPIYYYINGRISINGTKYWTWYVDREQDNSIAVYTKKSMIELLEKYNGKKPIS